MRNKPSLDKTFLTYMNLRGYKQIRYIKCNDNQPLNKSNKKQPNIHGQTDFSMETSQDEGKPWDHLGCLKFATTNKQYKILL